MENKPTDSIVEIMAKKGEEANRARKEREKKTGITIEPFAQEEKRQEMKIGVGLAAFIEHTFHEGDKVALVNGQFIYPLGAMKKHSEVSTIDPMIVPKGCMAFRMDGWASGEDNVHSLLLGPWAAPEWWDSDENLKEYSAGDRFSTDDL